MAETPGWVIRLRATGEVGGEFEHEVDARECARRLVEAGHDVEVLAAASSRLDQDRADQMAVGLMRLRAALDELIGADRELENHGSTPHPAVAAASSSSVVLRPGDTVLVGLAAGADVDEQARRLERLPDHVPGVDVVLLRDVSALGVVRYDDRDIEDQADELIAAREEVAQERQAAQHAQQRLDDIVTEHVRQLAALGRHVRAWATLITTALPEVVDVTTADGEIGQALRSMLRVAEDLDGGTGRG